MIDMHALTGPDPQPVGRMTGTDLETELLSLSLAIAEDVSAGRRAAERDLSRFRYLHNELRSRAPRVEKLAGESYGDYVARCLQSAAGGDSTAEQPC